MTTPIYDDDEDKQTHDLQNMTATEYPEPEGPQDDE